MDKAFKKLSVILIVINCLVTFQLFGMPKFYTNKHHFFGIFPHRPYIYVCSPLNDMTLKDDKGNDVQITVNDRLAITQADEISKEIDGILDADKNDDQTAEGGSGDTEICTVRIIDKDPILKISKNEFYDTSKFKDITEEVNKEYDAAIALEKSEGEKKYSEYMLHQRLWFFFPIEYISNYIVGLVAAAVAFLVIFLIRRKDPAPAVVLSLIMICLKIIGIIYVYANPIVCA